MNVNVMCSLAEQLKAVPPAIDFSIDAAHEVSTALNTELLIE